MKIVLCYNVRKGKGDIWISLSFYGLHLISSNILKNTQSFETFYSNINMYLKLLIFYLVHVVLPTNQSATVPIGRNYRRCD